MGFLDYFRNREPTAAKVSASYKLITVDNQGFFSFDGKLYRSDFITSCIRPKAKAIGKAVATHMRGNDKFPETYMRALLERPNPLMSGQVLQERMIWLKELNGNAFALIQRNDDGYPIGIYPLSVNVAKMIESSSGNLYLECSIIGKTYTFAYSDIIHLRGDMSGSEIFGNSPIEQLKDVMEVVTTIDQGIIKAIRNGNLIRWLLKFQNVLKDEDIKESTERFVKAFLSSESDTIGAAAVDARMDAQQVEPKDYVPHALQMDRTYQRIYNYFGTNQAIVQSKYSENEWISYYENQIEPDIVQFSNELTHKLFTAKERGHKNRIILEGMNLTFASMQTKLSMSKFVELGILSPNEVRELLHYAPREGGDEYVRRLDTRPTEEGLKENLNRYKVQNVAKST